MSINTTREYLLKEYKDLLSSSKEEERFLERCVEWLADADVHSCFKVLPFGDIKNGYLEKIQEKKLGNRFDELEDALKNLEKYVQNLWKKPWCKAFYMIKTFNGFFKYKIEQWLPLDTIFKVLELMGYHKTSEGIFEIEKLNEERVLVVGLELYFAHTQLFLCRTRLLGNYTVDNILEAWIQTNGRSTRLENGLLKKILAKDSFEPSSDSSHATTKSSAITTTTRHQHYDKNGQSTYQNINCLKTSGLEQAYTMSSEDKMPSLPTLSISSDQMYGELETDAISQNHNGYLASHQQLSFLNRKTRNSGNCNTGTYMSMPVVRAKPRSDSAEYHHSKNNLQNLSVEQLYGSSYKDTTQNMNKHKEDDFSYQNEREKTKENMVAQVKPRESELYSHQESFDEEMEKCQKIIQGRVEEGERGLQQEQTKDRNEIIIATDVTNKEQWCYICDNTASIACKNCRERVCRDCYNIFKRIPCTKENQHEYCIIKNYDSLYENE